MGGKWIRWETSITTPVWVRDNGERPGCTTRKLMEEEWLEHKSFKETPFESV